MGFFTKVVKDKDQITENETALVPIEEPPVELSKQDAKNAAKAQVGKKFVVGKVYMLRQKSVCGSKEIVKKYVLKKFIYTSKSEFLNVLILKQIDGPIGTIFTLNRNDCKRYHIKYEPGLQVFSMEFNWIPCKY